MADMEREIIKDGDWIAKYLENDHLTIKDVPDGDCFMVTEALESIGKNISVQKIRRLLSEQVTDDMFQQYLMLYKSTVDELNKITTQVRKLKQNLMIIPNSLNYQLIKLNKCNYNN